CTRFAFDVITEEQNPRHSKLVGMSFCWQTGRGYYLPVLGPEHQKLLPEAELLKKLKRVFEDGNIQKVGHDLKFEMAWLHHQGIRLQGLSGDAMIASYLL
ncbi:MAG TPA: hypothetical protein PKA06_16075, partial [Gemmatales bacterium]|nr:hypothetical protein [Gemmatales bacterium]